MVIVQFLQLCSTPLHFACKRGKVAAAAALLLHGADTTVENDEYFVEGTRPADVIPKSAPHGMKQAMIRGGESSDLCLHWLLQMCDEEELPCSSIVDPSEVAQRVLSVLREDGMLGGDPKVSRRFALPLELIVALDRFRAQGLQTSVSALKLAQAMASAEDVAEPIRHDEAVRSRASPDKPISGDLMAHHPKLRRLARPPGADSRVQPQLDPASQGSSRILERLGTQECSWLHVIEGGVSQRAGGDATRLTASQRGRARPLFWDGSQYGAVGSDVAAERQGCNSLVFAVESTGKDPSSLEGCRSPWREGWQGVLKGGIPVGASADYYSGVAQRQQQDWLLPGVVGERKDKYGEVVLEGHPNVLQVHHSWLGSTQLMLPWLDWMQRRRTTWTLAERFPTTLKGAAAASLSDGGPGLSCRQMALWLLQVLQGLEHARSRGVVHRDVKADNVFLTADGRVVVGDWGEGCLLYEGGLRVRVDETLAARVRLQQLDDAAADGISQPAGDPAVVDAAGGDAAPSSSDGEASVFLADPVPEEEEERVDEPVHPEPLFIGAGDGVKPETLASSMLMIVGGMGARAPEVYHRAMHKDALDAWGRPIETLAQIYASSDAWAAGRMIWELFATQALARGGSEAKLPPPDSLYADKLIPPLPRESGCSAGLEAVLRGLLQANPAHRLPQNVAIDSLHWMLYGRAGSAGSPLSSWIGDQQKCFADADLALAPLPVAALVGMEIGADASIEASARVGEPSVPAASGAGADPPREEGSRDSPMESFSLQEADRLIQHAVQASAANLEPSVSADNSGQLAQGEIAAGVRGMSMGNVGGHRFEGPMCKAIGAGVLQSSVDAEKAVIVAGPLASLRPPSAGTRALFGWSVKGVLGRVRPLVEGEASMWDRQLRRQFFQKDDVLEHVQGCCRAHEQLLACFKVGGAGQWDGPRNGSWVPAADGQTPEQSQSLPEGWVEMHGPGGEVLYWNRVTGQTSQHRPTAGGAGSVAGSAPAPAPPT